MEKGDLIPDLTLRNQENKEVNLRAYVGKNPLVVYFYPKDNTPGCIREACSFRDQYEEFEDIGAKVFGISQDSVESHKKFSERYRLSFQLLSDKDRKAEKAFGVPRRLFGLLPGRVTFIFDVDGKLIHTFNSSLQPAKHIHESIEALQSQ